MNKQLLVPGNPTLNQGIWTLFKKIITEKDSDKQSFGKKGGESSFSPLVRKSKYMTSKIHFVLLILFCFGCTDNRRKAENRTEITFRKEMAIRVADAKIFKSKITILLEITDQSLIAANASLRKEKENFFVYSNHRSNSVLRFDSEGKFLNTIGNIGIGPEEFQVMTDVFIFAADKSVEILSDRMIQRYDYNGKFIESLDLNIPAFSFIRTESGYCFYTGNNKAYSPYRIFLTDNALKKKGEYLNDDSNMLPMMVTTFGSSTPPTFWENFYSNLYRITNDGPELSYTVKFPGLEVPSEAHKLSPMDVVDYLRKYNYATIMRYLENQNYVFLMVMENKNGDKPSIYQWFINKKNSRETIVLIDFVMDSYLLYPQFLTEDNHLYYLGYPVENEEEEVDSNRNPSIVTVNISDM
jgi:hypothetical protein